MVCLRSENATYKRVAVKQGGKMSRAFTDECGERWWRIVGLARDLGVTEMCIRNWIEQGLVECCRVEGDLRPRVRLKEGVVVKEGARRGMLVRSEEGGAGRSGEGGAE